MRCEQLREALLTEDLDSLDAAHLAECDACRALVEQARREQAAMHAVLTSWNERPIPEPRRWQPPIRTIAVVLAIAATIALALYSLSLSPPDRPERPATPPIAPYDAGPDTSPRREETKPTPRPAPRPTPRPAPRPAPMRRLPAPAPSPTTGGR